MPGRSARTERAGARHQQHGRWLTSVAGMASVPEAGNGWTGRRTRRPSPGRELTSPFAFAAGLLAAAVFLVPLVGLLWRMPWTDTVDVLGDRRARTSLRLSLVCSLSAMAVSIVLGLPLAWLLARSRFPGRRLLRAAVTLPMVLPPVVGGIALLYALGRRGLVGRYLDSWLGIRLPFTTAGAVVAETFVALPFFVVTMEAALRSMDRRLEDAARTLRANRLQTFWHITLPLVRPSLVAGAVLCWARALGEFGATITFAGNFPERTQTLPLAIYLAQEGGSSGDALVLSLVLLVVSVAVLASLRDRWLGPA
jgi:molybdate transport system permease protein